MEASSETWDAATSFELYSPPTTTSEPVVSGDGKNTVGWGLLDPGIIAVTTIWYNPATKQIVEFDTIFNTYYPWSTSGEAGKMDLQNIATHELGHNGLADLRPPRDAELTMYYASTFGETKKRSLGVGDILGIQELYGV
ncbi:MAG: matrixin family metalloprotease [Nitrososphaeria archaeon]